jgi:hypothetical protein
MWTPEKLIEVNQQLTSARALVQVVEDKATDDDEEMAERMYHIGEYLDNELEGIKDWFSRHVRPGIVFEDNETESAPAPAETKISLTRTAALATVKAGRLTARLTRATSAALVAFGDPSRYVRWRLFLAVCAFVAVTQLLVRFSSKLTGG